MDLQLPARFSGIIARTGHSLDALAASVKRIGEVVKFAVCLWIMRYTKTHLNLERQQCWPGNYYD